jgi:hypothetical protein
MAISSEVTPETLERLKRKKKKEKKMAMLEKNEC